MNRVSTSRYLKKLFGVALAQYFEAIPLSVRLDGISHSDSSSKTIGCTNQFCYIKYEEFSIDISNYICKENIR